MYLDKSWKEMCRMLANLVADSGTGKGPLVLMFSCLNKKMFFCSHVFQKHVLLFFCLNKTTFLCLTKQNRTESYSIARIVLNRMIDVLGCINFAHAIQRAHVQRPSTSGLLTRDYTLWPMPLLERRLEYNVNGPRQ